MALSRQLSTAIAKNHFIGYAVVPTDTRKDTRKVFQRATRRFITVARFTGHKVGAEDLASQASDNDAAADPSAAVATPSRMLVWGCYSVFASMYMLVSIVAPFFPRKAHLWGISELMVGVIIACDPVGEVMASLVALYLMNKVGRRNLAVGGMLVNGLSSVVFGLIPLVTTNPSILVPVFVVSRLANGVATTLTYVSVFALLCGLQPDKMGQVTAYSEMLSSVGLIVGPPFGGMLYTLGESVPFLRENVGAFGVPFIGCSIVLVIPSFLLWTSGGQTISTSVKGVKEEEEEEEEEETSCTGELRKMASVFNLQLFSGIVAVIASMALSNAIYVVLGPHLEAAPAVDASSDPALLEMRRHPLAFSHLQISWTFSAGTIGYLPMALWAGTESDNHPGNFSWYRQRMVAGLLLNAVAFWLMGPLPLLGPDSALLETSACILGAQLLLGASNALTCITAFPYFEAIADHGTRGAGHDKETLVAIAGTWYNASYSIGCALGPLLAGMLSTWLDFADVLFVLSLASLGAAVFTFGQGALDKSVLGGVCRAPPDEGTEERGLGESLVAMEEVAATDPASDKKEVGMSGALGGGLTLESADSGEEESEESGGSGLKFAAAGLLFAVLVVFMVIQAIGVSKCTPRFNVSVPTCLPEAFDPSCRNSSSSDGSFDDGPGSTSSMADFVCCGGADPRNALEC